ncbi:MAG: glycerol-3-phosphate 1-O-acyltransferase PlsY [Lentisphaeria bacterium]|nr:glycerol-3-phosphate 1-O-acyltransferase PlsY [Lentisphaeria bacterium]
MLDYFAVFAVSYLIGAVPFGFLIGKCLHKDIRKEGSGNIGATNVTRVIGKWWGRLCFFLDFLKGFGPVFAVSCIYAAPEAPVPGTLLLTAGAATILGHMFPVYLKFKGGKGISTAAGVALALAGWALLAAGLVWVAVFFISRYVSLASILAAVALPLAAAALNLWYRPVPLSIRIFFAFIAVVAIYKHRSNIVRLKNGTELRFERKKKN